MADLARDAPAEHEESPQRDKALLSAMRPAGRCLPLQALARYRPRLVTLVVLLSVAMLLALANLSYEFQSVDGVDGGESWESYPHRAAVPNNEDALE